MIKCITIVYKIEADTKESSRQHPVMYPSSVLTS